MASLGLSDPGVVEDELNSMSSMRDWGLQPGPAPDTPRLEQDVAPGERPPAASPGSVGGRGGGVAAAISKKRRNRSGPKSKSSPFIGVSQYKRTGRWEAHIWDSESAPEEVPEDSGGDDGSTVARGKGGSGKGKKQPQRQGRQIHLGSFLTAIQAARWAPLLHMFLS